MRPLVDEGIILVSEEQAINSNLKHLSAKGTLMPSITPKLIDQKEAAEMLGLGFSNFKKLEKEGAFPFTRKMVGSAVRYRNTDIVKYIMAEDIE
jgi:predicted DNA-binding transcriptional regulator AlpA